MKNARTILVTVLCMSQVIPAASWGQERERINIPMGTASAIDEVHDFMKGTLRCPKVNDEKFWKDLAENTSKSETDEDQKFAELFNESLEEVNRQEIARGDLDDLAEKIAGLSIEEHDEILAELAQCFEAVPASWGDIQYLFESIYEKVRPELEREDLKKVGDEFGSYVKETVLYTFGVFLGAGAIRYFLKRGKVPVEGASSAARAEVAAAEEAAKEGLFRRMMNRITGGQTVPRYNAEGFEIRPIRVILAEAEAGRKRLQAEYNMYSHRLNKAKGKKVELPLMLRPKSPDYTYDVIPDAANPGKFLVKTRTISDPQKMAELWEEIELSTRGSRIDEIRKRFDLRNTQKNWNETTPELEKMARLAESPVPQRGLLYRGGAFGFRKIYLAPSVLMGGDYALRYFRARKSTRQDPRVILMAAQTRVIRNLGAIADDLVMLADQLGRAVKDGEEGLEQIKTELTTVLEEGNAGLELRVHARTSALMSSTRVLLGVADDLKAVLSDDLMKTQRDHGFHLPIDPEKVFHGLMGSNATSTYAHYLNRNVERIGKHLEFFGSEFEAKVLDPEQRRELMEDRTLVSTRLSQASATTSEALQRVTVMTTSSTELVANLRKNLALESKELNEMRAEQRRKVLEKINEGIQDFGRNFRGGFNGLIGK